MLDLDLATIEKKLLFKEGDPATDLYLVKTGRILCLKKSKDRLIPIFIAKEQDIVGEVAMVDNGVYQYSAISLGDTELVPVPHAHFEDAFIKSPEWIKILSELMVNRHAKTTNLIAENRVLSPLVISDEEYTAEIEVELKRIVS